MKVLHVALGLPPLRTGGLTRYCVDLMEAQARGGFKVSLLYPGRFLPGKTVVKSHRHGDIQLYEVVNPLPVPLTCGVGDPRPFIADCDNPEAYRGLLEEVEPDIIHVHSYQGIHKEFFDIAARNRMPIVFTTHDYYPICPRCTLVDRFEEACEGPASERCAACNAGIGMTLHKSMIMQSGVYAKLKGSRILSLIAARVKQNMSSGGGSAAIEQPANASMGDYRALLDYNRSVVSAFDLIVSNSLVSEQIYRRYYPNKSFRLVPGTHAGLSRREHAECRRKSDETPRIAYFGGKKAYKGYETLMTACRLLHEEGVEFQLDLYGDDYEQPQGLPEVTCGGRISPEKVRGILREHDVVVVPSIYRETCGFVVLEALCEGVAVVCSDAVGAADLVEPDRVFKAGVASDLAIKLKDACENRNIPVSVSDDYPITMNQQIYLLKRIYHSLIREVSYESK